MGYQPQPSASTLIILDITKTSCNNCLLIVYQNVNSVFIYNYLYFYIQLLIL